MLIDSAKDAALAVIAGANRLCICSADPATFTAANVTNMLGYKDNPTISAAADGTPDGRSITISAITDGAAVNAGKPTYYALVNTTSSTLIKTGALGASPNITGAGTFTLGAFTIRFPD